MSEIMIKDLYNMNETIAAELFNGLTYPWEALPKIGEFIKKLERPLIRKNMIKWARMCGSQNPPTYFRPHMYMDRRSSEKTQKFVTVHLSAAMPL